MVAGGGTIEAGGGGGAASDAERTAPSLAVCLSGSLRTFASTGPFLVAAVQPSLPSIWMAAVNVQNPNDVEPAQALLSRTLHSGALIDVVVSHRSDAQCSDIRGQAQAAGLVKCWGMLERLRSRGFRFRWVLRTRPDVILPWILASLPVLPPQLDLVIAGYVGGCECPAKGTPTHCAHGGLHACIEDGTALIHGIHAQRTYLYEFGNDFNALNGHACRTPQTPQRRHTLTCPVCRVGASRGACAECKLGASLAARGIPTFGLAPMLNTTAAAIVRAHTSNPLMKLKRSPVVVSGDMLKQSLDRGSCSQCVPLRHLINQTSS